MWLRLVAVVGAGLALAGCPPKPDAPKKTLAATSLCDERICVVARIVGQDRDGDGVTDEDEKAAGTNPDDPASRPPVRKLLEMIGTGLSPSFDRGVTEVIALPDTAPNGAVVDARDPLSTGPSVGKRGGLEAMGISAAALKKAGISIDQGFVVGIAAPGASGSPPAGTPPRVRVGGMDIALLSQGSIFLNKYKGSYMDAPPENGTPNPPDGGTPAPGNGGTPDAGTPGAKTDTKTEPGWFCSNLGWFCGRSDDDPAGNNISVVEVTAADLARVKAKLGSTRRPGPDTPSPVDAATPIVERDPRGPIMLYDPDAKAQEGILLSAPRAGGNPQTNSNFGPRIIDQIVTSPGGVPSRNPGACPQGQRC